jgi:hypothetical protein
MPSCSFIHKDFIEAFFGPTIDFRDRLRNLTDNSNGRKPDLDNSSRYSSSSEDDSSEETSDMEEGESSSFEDDSSLLEETPDMEEDDSSQLRTADEKNSSPVMGRPHPSPTPCLVATTGPAATDINNVGGRGLHGPGIQGDPPGASSSVVGSPELSAIASISPLSFTETLTPCRPSEPTMKIVAPSTEIDLDQGGTNYLCIPNSFLPSP